jgi:hypothetical protein
MDRFRAGIASQRKGSAVGGRRAHRNHQVQSDSADGRNFTKSDIILHGAVMADFDLDAPDLDRSIKALTLSRTLTRMLNRPEIRKLTDVQ